MPQSKILSKQASGDYLEDSGPQYISIAAVEETPSFRHDPYSFEGQVTVVASSSSNDTVCTDINTNTSHETEGCAGEITPQRTTPAPSPAYQRQKPMRQWELLPHPGKDAAGMLAFQPGFVIQVYDSKLLNCFDVPSESVTPTHGSIRYIEHYNEHGPYSRFRFQLCQNHLRGRCRKGFECTYVHANTLPDANSIHLQGRMYPTLAPGLVVPVFTPQTETNPQFTPSEYILVTEGALHVAKMLASGTAPSDGALRPQHCAHFQYKKMCNRGPMCHFIHSLVPAPRYHERAGTHADAAQPTGAW